MYKPKFFKSYELVPQEIYDLLGEENSFKLFDKKLLITIDEIRSYFNCSMVINNWKFGGNFGFRGFRPKNYKSGMAHKLGFAVDFDLYKKGRLDPFKVREIIIDKRDLFSYIKGIEIGVNWVHIDVLTHIHTPKRPELKDGEIFVFDSKGQECQII